MKIVSNPNTLINKVFKTEFEILEEGNNGNNYQNFNGALSWVRQIKNLLCEFGFAYLWESQSITNLQLQLVIQRLYDQYIQNWYSYVNNSPKLTTYKIVKIQFCHEKSFSCVLKNKHRVSLSRLRCSAHNLLIEDGRYRNIEGNMRLCQFCNMNLMENEFHFLLICPAFRTLRAACLPAYYCSWPTITKFIQLMTDSLSRNIQSLAKYVYLAFEHRKSLLM